MRKNVIISALFMISFSIVAYAYFSNRYPEADSVSACNSPSKAFEQQFKLPSEKKDIEFVYELGTRYLTQITKKELMDINSISDVLPADAMEDIVSCHKNIVTHVKPDKSITKYGEGDVLTEEQIGLLRSLDYSDDFCIWADSYRKNSYTGKPEVYDLIYYLTIVPESQAEYMDGQGALLNYLKNVSLEYQMGMDPNVLKPARMRFTVNKEGRIQDVIVESSCAYSEMDDVLKDALVNAPGEWRVAKDDLGNSVSQDFVFYYGLRGC